MIFKEKKVLFIHVYSVFAQFIQNMKNENKHYFTSIGPTLCECIKGLECSEFQLNASCLKPKDNKWQ